MFFFLEGFSAKQQCLYPKMTGQNDHQDESLTGQVHNQAGHCPLTGRYFQPWHRVLKCQSLSTTVLFRTTAAVCSPCRWSCSTYLSNDSWIQTFYCFIFNCHTIKWLFNDNQITGLWCYNNCLLMLTCPAITFALLILWKWRPCFWLDLI